MPCLFSYSSFHQLWPTSTEYRSTYSMILPQTLWVGLFWVIYNVSFLPHKVFCMQANKFLSHWTRASSSTFLLCPLNGFVTNCKQDIISAMTLFKMTKFMKCRAISYPVAVNLCNSFRVPMGLLAASLINQDHFKILQKTLNCLETKYSKLRSWQNFC